MAFNKLVSLALGLGNAKHLIAPISALAQPQILIPSLKGAVNTIAQVRDPITTASANMNVADITGVGRVRIYPRLSNLAGLAFSDARFAVIAGYAKRIKRDSASIIFEDIQLIQRLDSTDLTTAIGPTSGLAAGIPGSPSSSNMMVAPPTGAATGANPGYLVGNPVLFTDENGAIRPYLDVAAFNFLLTPLLVASTGTVVSTTVGIETGELVVSPAN